MKQLTPQKTVNYFGIYLIVPDEKGWLTTDSDGSVYWYDTKPVKDGYEWGGDYGSMIFICKVDLEGMDWKNSLMEVK
jgi:hypothetical protein